MVEYLRFPSGLTFAFKRFKEAKSISIGFWLKKGARVEPLKLKGIAHFLEHLLFKGTKNYSYRKIKQEIEGRGGQLNAFTSQEVICYFAKVLRKNADIALDVLSDMLVFPLLRKEDIDKERGVILEEIRMYKDMPSSRVVSILDSLLWGKHPLGMDVIGSEDTVKKISQEDLRQFKERFYSPSNTVVVVSGEDIPNFFEGVVKKFKSLASKSRYIEKFPKPRIKKGFDFKQEVTSFEQTHLCLGFRGFSYFDERRFILELINVILGGNMSSRLFEAIRERRGLAYEVSTSLKKYRDSGAFLIHCGLEEKNVALAFKVIVKELNRLKKELISKAELVRAKDYFLGNFSMGLESTLNSMFYIGESLCKLGKVLDYGEIEKKILKITPLQVREIARRVFSPDVLKVALVTKQSRTLSPCFRNILKSLS